MLQHDIHKLFHQLTDKSLTSYTEKYIFWLHHPHWTLILISLSCMEKMSGCILFLSGRLMVLSNITAYMDKGKCNSTAANQWICDPTVSRPDHTERFTGHMSSIESPRSNSYADWYNKQPLNLLQPCVRCQTCRLTARQFYRVEPQMHILERSWYIFNDIMFFIDVGHSGIYSKTLQW